MPDNEAADIDAILAGTKRPAPRKVAPTVPAGKLAAPADEFDDEDMANVRKLAGNTPVAQMDAAPDVAAERARQLAASAPLRGDQRPSHELPWYTNAFNDAPVVPVIAENLASGALSNTTDEAQAALFTPKTDPRDEMKFGVSAGANQNTYAEGSQMEAARRIMEQEKHERDKASPTGAVVGQLAGGAVQGAILPESLPATLALAPGLTALDYVAQGSGDLSERAGQAVETAKENPLATLGSVGLPVMGSIASKFGKSAPKYTNQALDSRAKAFLPSSAQQAIVENKGIRGGEQHMRDLAREAEKRGFHKTNKAEGDGIFPNARTYARNAEDYSKAANAEFKQTEGDLFSLIDPGADTGKIVNELRVEAQRLFSLSDPDSKALAKYYSEQADALESSQIKVPGTPGPKPTAPWEVGPVEGPWTPGREPTYAPADPADLKAFESLLEPTARTPPVTPTPIERPVEPLSPWFEGPWTAEQPGVHPTASQKGAQTKLINKAKKAGEPLPAPLEERATVPPQGPGPEPPEGHVLQHKQAIKEQQGQYKKESAAQERQYKQDVKEYKTGQKEYEALKKKFDAAQAKGPPKGKMIDKGEEPRFYSRTNDLPDTPSQEELDAFYAAQKEHLTPEPVPSGMTPTSKALAIRRVKDAATKFDLGGGVQDAGMKAAVRHLTANRLRGATEEAWQNAVKRGEVPQELVDKWMKNKEDIHIAESIRQPATELMFKNPDGSNMALQDASALMLAQNAGLPAPLLAAAGGAKTARQATKNVWPSINAERLHAKAAVARGVDKLAPKTTGYVGAQASRPSSEEQKAKNQTLTEKLAELSHGSWNWLEKHLPGG